MRLGLCCAFRSEDIRFRTTTATSFSRLGRTARAAKLREIAAHNAMALAAAIRYCTAHAIGCFRVTSNILPLKTHPTLGYQAGQLGQDIIAAFRSCGDLAREKQIRISFHPDQFVVLNSPHPRVVSSSLAELEYQAEVAEWIGADVINLHGGGGYGDKPAALKRLIKNIRRLPARSLSENPL